MQKQWPYRLLAPGPVPLPQPVLRALSQPAVHHRTPAFQKMIEESFSNLKKVFKTKQPVLIQTCTGTGVMESALVNTLQKGDKVLSVIGGKFGERWAEMARLFGAEVIEMSLPWGEALELQRFESLLKQNKGLKLVLTQACETSTATVFPIKEMAKLVRTHTSALMMVDAITAVGCMDLPMDEWEIDVIVAGSQKAFMLPTGLGFIAISERAQKVAKENLTPRFYFDWNLELKNYPMTTHFSSPNSMIVALNEVLKIFEKHGFEVIQKRCETLARMTREAAVDLGLSVFSKSPSSSVTAIGLPENIAGEKLRQWLEDEKNITVMGGQDQLKNKVLRIGHMGAITNEDMLVFFEALAQGLQLALPDGFREKHLKTLSQSKEYFQ